MQRREEVTDEAPHEDEGAVHQFCVGGQRQVVDQRQDDAQRNHGQTGGQTEEHSRCGDDQQHAEAGCAVEQSRNAIHDSVQALDGVLHEVHADEHGQGAGADALVSGFCIGFHVFQTPEQEDDDKAQRNRDVHFNAEDTVKDHRHINRREVNQQTAEGFQLIAAAFGFDVLVLVNVQEVGCSLHQNDEAKVHADETVKVHIRKNGGHHDDSGTGRQQEHGNVSEGQIDNAADFWRHLHVLTDFINKWDGQRRAARYGKHTDDRRQNGDDGFLAVDQLFQAVNDLVQNTVVLHQSAQHTDDKNNDDGLEGRRSGEHAHKVTQDAHWRKTGDEAEDQTGQQKHGAEAQFLLAPERHQSKGHRNG